MEKMIGFFKVTNKKAIEEAIKMKEERKSGNSLGAEMTFFGVELYLDIAVNNGEAEKIEGYKMPCEVDYQYFLEATPPYIMKRVVCYEEKCTKKDPICKYCKLGK